LQNLICIVIDLTILFIWTL